MPNVAKMADFKKKQVRVDLLPDDYATLCAISERLSQDNSATMRILIRLGKDLDYNQAFPPISSNDAKAIEKISRELCISIHAVLPLLISMGLKLRYNHVFPQVDGLGNPIY